MNRWFFIAALAISPAIAFSQGSYLNILGIIRGDSGGAQFGKKVVPAGDVNGDSIPDFLVGAFGSKPVGPCCEPLGAQKIHLFYGKKGNLDTIPDMIFNHKYQLEMVGDLNGDGSKDFIMRETGQIYRHPIYFGGNLLDTIPDGIVKGDSSGVFLGDQFGLYISAGKACDSGDGTALILWENNFQAVFTYIVCRWGVKPKRRR